MFFSILWNAITGNLSGIVKAVTGVIGQMSDNEAAKFKAAVGADRDVAVAQLEASAKVYHDRVDLLKGMKITSWLIAIALIPPLYHQGLVFLDSCPFFLWYPHVVGSWDVPKLPGVYAEREWLMISSLLGIQAASTTAMSAIRYLRK